MNDEIKEVFKKRIAYITNDLLLDIPKIDKEDLVEMLSLVVLYMMAKKEELAEGAKQVHLNISTRVDCAEIISIPNLPIHKATVETALWMILDTNKFKNDSNYNGDILTNL